MSFDEFAEAMYQAAQDRKVVWATNNMGLLYGYAAGAEQWVDPLCAVALARFDKVVPDPDELAGMLGLSYETTERIVAALEGENDNDKKALLMNVALIAENRLPA